MRGHASRGVHSESAQVEHEQKVIANGANAAHQQVAQAPGQQWGKRQQLRALRAQLRGIVEEQQHATPAQGHQQCVASRLLAAVIDPPTGIVPNHGANDGALVLPLSSAPYRDFRPVLTAVAAVFGEALPRNIEPDEEVLAWLGLPRPKISAPIAAGVVVGSSGWQNEK